MHISWKEKRAKNTIILFFVEAQDAQEDHYSVIMKVGRMIQCTLYAVHQRFFTFFLIENEPSVRFADPAEYEPWRVLYTNILLRTEGYRCSIFSAKQGYIISFGIRYDKKNDKEIVSKRTGQNIGIPSRRKKKKKNNHSFSEKNNLTLDIIFRYVSSRS